MPHMSTRTLSVMVLQGTRCISLSRQSPPTSVICPSVYFSVCLVMSLSVSVSLYTSVCLPTHTDTSTRMFCDPSVHMHADMSKHSVTWSQLGDEKSHSFPFVLLLCPSFPFPSECAAMLESPVSRTKHFWHLDVQLIKLACVFSFWFL